MIIDINIVRGICILMILSMCPFSVAYNSIFSEPLQKPIEIERLIYTDRNDARLSGALAYMGIWNGYKTERIIEKQLNITLLYPFDKIEVWNNGARYDEDDIYLIRNYNLSVLMNCSRNATSIEEVYSCTAEFNKGLLKEGRGNCRISTSAFKLAFLNSKLYSNMNISTAEGNFKLMKAFAKGDTPSTKYSNHRFILLSNKNGNFVIDPYWGMFEDLNKSVVKYSRSFYDDDNSLNYRRLVYKVDYFYG
ncbi:MAG: hypothetical protein QW112_02320 [Candidatus Micrarchaeia archaeon]